MLGINSRQSMCPGWQTGLHPKSRVLSPAPPPKLPMRTNTVNQALRDPPKDWTKLSLYLSGHCEHPQNGVHARLCVFFETSGNIAGPFHVPLLSLPIIWRTLPRYMMQLKPIKPGSIWDKGALQLAVLSVTADGGVFACPDLSSWSQKLAPDTFIRSAGGTHSLKDKVNQEILPGSFLRGWWWSGKTKMTRSLVTCMLSPKSCVLPHLTVN